MISPLLPWLERAINHIIQQDPDARARLAPLAQKTLAIRLQDLAQTWGMTFANDRVLLHLNPATADVTLTTTLVALIALQLKGPSPATLTQYKVHVEGDIGVAQSWQQFWSELDIDWEEQLSQHVGDVLAHEMFRFGHAAKRFIKRQSREFAQHLGEYLQEEARLTPSQPELQRFFREIDELSSRYERLQMRTVR